MTRGRIALLVAVVLMVVIPIGAPWTRTFFTLALANGLAALGIVVLLRAGQVSFGHGMFFAASAYAAAYVAPLIGGAGLVVLLLVGIATSLVTGVILGLFLVRYRYIFFGMLNLAFSMVLYAVLEKFYYATGGSYGLSLPHPTVLGFSLSRVPFEYVLCYLTMALAALAAWLVHRYLASAPGKALAAIKTNETRLEYLGISPRLTLLAAYVLSAVLAGLGGTLTGLMEGTVTPAFSFWIRSAEFIFIAILGGVGHVLGAFAGALVYEAVRLYAADAFSNAWQLLLGVVLLLIIMFASGGLVGLARRFGFGGQKKQRPPKLKPMRAPPATPKGTPGSKAR